MKRMIIRMKWLLVPAVALLMPGLVTGLRAGPLAVIVHPGVPVEEISLEDLRAVSRGETQFWEGGAKIRLVVSPPDAPAARRFNEVVHRMDGDELKRYWIRKVFRGEIGVPPRTLPTDEKICEYVGSTPGALGFVEAEQATDGVRVLRIDGRSPGDAGYLLE